MSEGIIHTAATKFDHKKDDWKIYKTRLQGIFDKLKLDDTDDAKKRAVLLDCLATETYNELYGILYPVEPSKKTYAEIVKALDDHFTEV